MRVNTCTQLSSPAGSSTCLLYTSQWLKEHAAEYGFILRYPKDKTAITGTSFEPWHYRYVGVEDAQKIMAQGLCLEEYLAKVDEGVAAQVAAALENAGVTGTDTETGAASGSASPGSAASSSTASSSTASGSTASGSASPAQAGEMCIRDRSYNTVAVRVGAFVGVREMYDFITETLNIELDAERDMDYACLLYTSRCV